MKPSDASVIAKPHLGIVEVSPETTPSTPPFRSLSAPRTRARGPSETGSQILGRVACCTDNVILASAPRSSRHREHATSEDCPHDPE